MKPSALYVSCVYDLSATDTHAHGKGAAQATTWRLLCACPSCGRSVDINLVTHFSGRGQVISDAADQPAEAGCRTCGSRPTERTLRLCGTAVQWASAPIARAELDGMQHTSW
jgi:hypothetical protein